MIPLTSECVASWTRQLRCPYKSFRTFDPWTISLSRNLSDLMLTLSVPAKVPSTPSCRPFIFFSVLLCLLIPLFTHGCITSQILAFHQIGERHGLYTHPFLKPHIWIAYRTCSLTINILNFKYGYVTTASYSSYSPKAYACIPEVTRIARVIY